MIPGAIGATREHSSNSRIPSCFDLFQMWRARCHIRLSRFSIFDFRFFDCLARRLDRAETTDRRREHGPRGSLRCAIIPVAVASRPPTSKDEEGAAVGDDGSRAGEMPISCEPSGSPVTGLAPLPFSACPLRAVALEKVRSNPTPRNVRPNPERALKGANLSVLPFLPSNFFHRSGRIKLRDSIDIGYFRRLELVPRAAVTSKERHPCRPRVQQPPFRIDSTATNCLAGGPSGNLPFSDRAR